MSQERNNLEHSITAEAFSLLKGECRIPFGYHKFLYKTHLIHQGVGVPLMWKDGIPSKYTSLLLKGNYSLCEYSYIQKKEIVIARCGFNLGDKKLIITHTPQGTEAEYLKELGFSRSFSKKALAPLDNGFRESMIGDLIRLAGLLKLDEVVGTSASHHDKVIEGHITEDFARDRMDKPFEKNGFRLDKTMEKYIYDLKSASASEE
ncbi:MAG TPA: hypothetical protein VLE44_01935 [Candidatus Saccharimonadales bacterium]|nr:hypothetical protein [Candidatus Saccharimonadales bacterium]